MIHVHAARTGWWWWWWWGGRRHTEASRNDHLGPVTSVGEWMDPPSHSQQVMADVSLAISARGCRLVQQARGLLAHAGVGWFNRHVGLLAHAGVGWFNRHVVY